MSKLAGVLALLLSAGAGRADPTILVRGERLEVQASTPGFTFGVDDKQGESRTFPPGRESVLLEGAQLMAPPGLQVETLALRVNQSQLSRKEGRRKLTWPAYDISARLALTAGPQMAAGENALLYRFPGVARVRKQQGTAKPEDVALLVEVEVFESPGHVLQKRGPVIAWHAFASLGVLAITMLVSGFLFRLQLRSRHAFTAAALTAMFTVVAAMSALGFVAELMHWAVAAHPPLALAILVATNFCGGVCAFVGTGGLAATRQPVHRTLGLVCLVVAPLGVYFMGPQTPGPAFGPPILALALAGLVPGTLKGAARAAANKPEDVSTT